MAIPKYVSENFKRFLEVPKDRIALMEVINKRTEKVQYLIVVHGTDLTAKDGKTENFTPIARFFSYDKNDNPYSLYNPPI